MSALEVRPVDRSLGNRSATVVMSGNAMKVLLIILCLFFPFLAVLIKKGPCMAVVWAFLLQLLGHIPGVIYGIVKVTED